MKEAGMAGQAAVLKSDSSRLRVLGPNPLVRVSVMWGGIYAAVAIVLAAIASDMDAAGAIFVILIFIGALVSLIFAAVSIGMAAFGYFRTYRRARRAILEGEFLPDWVLG